jgi:isochorismate pyruvate lyase
MTIQEVRAAIDRIDRELVQLIAERQRWIEQAVAVKARDGLPALIPERVDEVLALVANEAKSAAVDPALVDRLWREMMEWFVAYEERALGQQLRL